MGIHRNWWSIEEGVDDQLRKVSADESIRQEIDPRLKQFTERWKQKSKNKTKLKTEKSKEDKERVFDANDMEVI